MMNINQKLDKYFSMTEEALTMCKVIKEEGNECIAMAKNYLSDAKHFREKGDLLTALAAASYAHAWLDSGARFGYLEVDNSKDLFVVD